MTRTVTETTAMDAVVASGGSPVVGRLRIVAAGSGREGLAEPQIRDTIIHLSNKSKPLVLYSGPRPTTWQRPKQTRRAGLRRSDAR